MPHPLYSPSKRGPAFSSTPIGFQELPIVLLFALCLAGAVVATSTLPLRFALVSSAGMALVGVSCFVKDIRMFYMTLLTLAIIFTTSKRLILASPMLPDIVDSISISLTDVFLLISYVLWFYSSLKDVRRGHALRRTLIGPFLGLCAVSLLSFANSSDATRGVFELVRMGKTLALYIFLIYNVRSLKEVRWILIFSGFGSFFVEFGFCVIEKYVVHGSLGLKYFGESEEGLESFVADTAVFRSGGTLGHPNNLAYYLDLMAPLMLTRVFALRSGRWTRRLFLLAFGAACACLYFTQSRRGSWRQASAFHFALRFWSGAISD